MEDFIGGLYVWDDNGRMVSCKGLEILEDDFNAVVRRSCVVW